MAKLGNLQGLSDLAKAATGKRGKEVLAIKIEDVVSKEQIRKKFKNIDELATSMKEEGQQSPVIVYPKNENGKYVIQKGERRWRALQAAGIQTIDIMVNDKELSEVDETAGELIENIQRDDLTPLEIAYALKVFADAGWKQKAIAQRIGKSTIFVSTHLSLLKLPVCVRELYDNDICSDTETLNNLRLLFNLNEEQCSAVCINALEDGITRKQSRDLLNDAKRILEEANSSQNDNVVDGNFTNNIDDQNAFEAQFGAEAGDNQDALEAPSSTTTNDYEDALPALPKDKDWKPVEAKELIIVVNVLTETDVVRGILLLDRACLDPKEVWVKVLDGKAEKKVKVLTSDIEIVSMGTL
ncbi:MAG: ParB/RepB/Spo0J family partition protein [Vibrio gallaecicus]